MAFISVVLASLILVLLVRTKGTKKNITPKRTKKQQQTDELITVILPTLNNDK